MKLSFRWYGADDKVTDVYKRQGLDGVAEELEKEGYAKDSIEKYLDLFKGIESAENGKMCIRDRCMCAVICQCSYICHAQRGT